MYRYFPDAFVRFALISNYESAPSSSISYYSSDAPSPNKPELIINYTDSGTYYGNRPYLSVDERSMNCMGYALDINMNIDANRLEIGVSDLRGKTVSVIHNFYVSKIEEWMNKYIGYRNWSRITSYNSDIGLNQYRLVNRTAFHDRAVGSRPLNNTWDIKSDKWGDPRPEYDESFDNHWWYQTNTGYWAEKPSTSCLIPVYNPGNDMTPICGFSLIRV